MVTSPKKAASAELIESAIGDWMMTIRVYEKAGELNQMTLP